MKVAKMRPVVLTTLCISLIAIAGCGSGNKPGGGTGKPGKKGQGAKVAGEILIEGSSTVEPISNQAKEKFKDEFPNVKINVGGEGTSNGFKSFQEGKTDISDASRPIKQKELDACKKNNVEFIEIPVAYDGLTFVVNKENDWLTQLTLDELRKIFVEGGAKTWKEVNSSWPDEKIAAFIPGTGSGTYDYAHEILAKKDKKKLRDDTDVVTMSENDDVLVDGVKNNKYGIGFFGFAYYEGNQDALNSVKIVNPGNNQAIEPTMKTIESGDYAPFSRPLLIYVNKESLAKLQVSKFVNFYVDNAATLAVDAKYVALPKSIYELVKNNLEDEVIGTHFLDDDGEKRPGALADVFKAENLKK